MFLAEEDLDGARSQLIFKLRTSEVVEDERANTRLVNADARAAAFAELVLHVGSTCGLVVGARIDAAVPAREAGRGEMRGKLAGNARVLHLAQSRERTCPVSR